MAFIVIAGKAYVYVSESNEISRFQYDPNHHTLLHKEVIVPNLPDTSSAELRSSYRHELKNLAISPDRHLYVDIASSTNADPTDTTSDPIRCAIYRYDLDGGNRTLFAKGIRNAEGLDFVPVSNALWAVVNGSDDIRFPYHRSWMATSMTIRQIHSFMLDRERTTGGLSLNRTRIARVVWMTCRSIRITITIRIGANIRSQGSRAAIKGSKHTRRR